MQRSGQFSITQAGSGQLRGCASYTQILFMISLKTLKDATEQEVFDQVATHLLKQNEQSCRGTMCAYRGDGGLKCAAGCLIGDDEYSREWDENFIGWPKLVTKGIVPHLHGALVGRLQQIHDIYAPEQWKAELANVADYFKLNTNALLNFHRCFYYGREV